jgi:gas vesicle protein
MYCNCNSNSMKSKQHLVLGLLAGAALGAAIGMMFSPYKGKTIRKIIRKKGENIAGDVFDTIEDRVEQFGDTVSEKLDRLKRDLKSKFA